ncbi:MAG: DUF3783 domain-containing protein [Gemmiger sp.]
MKAHITEDSRAVLLWNFGPQSGGYSGVERAARAFHLKVRCLTVDDLHSEVGDLCKGKLSLERVEPSEGEAWPVPAMVIGGLDHRNGDLNEFLKAVKASGAQIPVKATVTPTSRYWTLARLLTELCAEHEALSGATQENAQ